MMKFKNTLIIFLGIIAIIFAGCKEKKATHESGTLEEPKVETYEENGVNFTRESYIGYEITYPSLDKKIVDKLLFNTATINIHVMGMRSLHTVLMKLIKESRIIYGHIINYGHYLMT